MEKVISAIGEQMQTLSRSIQKQSELLFDALAPLKKLPELLQTQTKAVQESLSDNIRAQILVSIANQKGALASKDMQIKEELQQVTRIENKLQNTVNKIHEEKRAKLKKIEQETESSVDQLDAPVMNLTRKIFMSSIHLPMTESIVPNMQLVNGVGVGSTECRHLAFDEARQSVINGLDFYRALIQDVRQKAMGLTHRDIDVPEKLSVPVMAVEYEVDGEVMRTFFAAPSVNSVGEIEERLPWFREMLDSEDALWRTALPQNLNVENTTAEQLCTRYCQEGNR